MTHEPTARRKMKNCDVVDTSPRVVEYFSALASDYQSGSARFPWAWARAHERAAIRSLLGDIAGADIVIIGENAGQRSVGLDAVDPIFLRPGTRLVLLSVQRRIGTWWPITTWTR